MLSFNTTQQHNTSQLDKTLSQKDEPQFFAVITALPSNLPTGPELAIKFEERGVRKVTTKEVSEKLPPQGKFSADWSKTCRQVGSDSSHHSFSRLVQYLPSSRVGFRRTDGRTDGRTKIFFQSPDGSSQFQPTGPKLAFKSGRIPTDGRTNIFCPVTSWQFSVSAD